MSPLVAPFGHLSASTSLHKNGAFHHRYAKTRAGPYQAATQGRCRFPASTAHHATSAAPFGPAGPLVRPRPTAPRYLSGALSGRRYPVHFFGALGQTRL